MRELGDRRELFGWRPASRAWTLGGIQPLLLDSVYFGGLLLSLPYLILRGRGGRVVEHLRRRTRSLPSRRGDRPCVWVHGVSVGEILSARSFLECLAREFPEWEIVLSTTTRAGLEAGRRHYGDRAMISYPFDLSYFVRRAFDRIRPDLVIIVEHELWPNFLWHARDRGVPVALVNGRLSPRSLRGYRLLSGVVHWPPAAIEMYCVEDETSAARFRSLGVPAERVSVTGNFKFDNTPAPGGDARAALGLEARHWVFLAASLHAGEEPAVVDAFERLRRDDHDARLVLVPRRLERVPDVEALLRRRGLRTARWSGRSRSRTEERAAVDAADAADAADATDVIIVDTYGDLQGLLPAAGAVFVGGSLVPFGGHNVIEPASLGRPVVIGPHHQNFHYVVSRFLEAGGLLLARDGRELGDRIVELRRRPEIARELARRARATIAAESGSSRRTLDALRPLLERVERRAAPPLSAPGAARRRWSGREMPPGAIGEQMSGADVQSHPAPSP